MTFDKNQNRTKRIQYKRNLEKYISTLDETIDSEAERRDNSEDALIVEYVEGYIQALSEVEADLKRLLKEGEI